MASTTKIGFVGAGRITVHHCNMLREVPEIGIAAICDIKEDRGRPLAEEYGVPWHDNYHAMFQKHPDIDLAVIATPSGMHHEHAMDILSRYSVHLLVEKPTFMHPAQYREAQALADKQGLHLFPVYHNRNNMAVRRVRSALEKGELGEIRMASVRLRWCRPQPYYDRDEWRGTYSHDGGAMTNQGVHYIDLLRHLGGEIKRVNTVARTLGADIEVEDTAAATFEFENGGVGVIEITTAARPDDFEASISLVGSKGMAVISGEATNKLITFTPAPDECDEHSEEFPIVYGFGHRDIYRDIASVLSGNHKFPIPFEDALKTIVLLHGLYRSDEVGDWIDVSEENASERLGRVNEEISEIYRTPAPKRD